MNKHFTYGERIINLEQSESQDNIEDLFVIGNQKISQPQPKNQDIRSDLDEQSNQTVKPHQRKRHSIQKKQKKQKKHKDKEKKHKNLKEKKRNHHKIQLIDEEEDQNNKKRIDQNYAVEKYSMVKQQILMNSLKCLEMKSLDSRLFNDFGVNQKIGNDCLLFDIIKFPRKELYLYGPLDSEIPRYRKPQDFDFIIGVKKSKQKKYKTIILDLKKVINQQPIRIKQINQNESTARYFHFQGYQDLNSQKINKSPQILQTTIFYAFSDKNQVQNLQEVRVLQINKQYNRKLAEDPTNIQIWINFVAIQDSLADLSDKKQKLAILEKKIAILEKAVSLNASAWKLAILYLDFLYEKQVNKTELVTKSFQFITINPDCIPLWQFYVSIRLQNFQQFSHAYLRNFYDEINSFLKEKIDKCSSATQIWKIRKVMLQILKMMVKLYKMQGYKELSTALASGLLEYNLFVPDEVIELTDLKKKQQMFVQYWEHYEYYKIGQVKEGSGWCHSKDQNLSEQNIESFLGKYETSNQAEQTNDWIEQQIWKTEIIWRPSHAKHDKSRIAKSPESFILIEDIQQALAIYRDSESLLILINAVVQNLEFPAIFPSNTYFNTFLLNSLQMHSHLVFSSQEQVPSDWFSQNQPLIWQRFWNPTKTCQIIPQHNWIKIQYLIRLLKSLKEKIPNTCLNQLNEYLMFLYCVLHNNPTISKTIKYEEQNCLFGMQSILQENPSHITIWVMYIESIYLKSYESEPCLQCYFQLIDSCLSRTDYSQQQITNQIQEIIFWLALFQKNHHLHLDQLILRLIYQMERQPKSIKITNIRDLASLSSFQCVMLQRSLLTKVEEHKCNQNQTKIMLINSYFIGFYTELHPSSTISLQKSIKINLLHFLDNSNNKNIVEKYIAVHILCIFHLLEFAQVETVLSKGIYILPLINYWLKLFIKPLIFFQPYFNRLEQKNLALWMISCMILWPRALKSQFYGFRNIWLENSKKLAFSGRIGQRQLEFILLLNRWLQKTEGKASSQFTFLSLDRMPFCKQLYLLHMKHQQKKVKQKMLIMMEEKDIRLFDNKYQFD